MSNVRSLSTQSKFYAIAFVLLAASLLRAQEHGAAIRVPTKSSLPAKELIGLPEVGVNTEGSLSLIGKEIVFTSRGVAAKIPRQRLIGVSTGEERVEMGGTTGRIARLVIPYGGGLALGAVAHKKVGLLTIEYFDKSDEYHGAVFVLSTDDIAVALARLNFQPAPATLASTEAPFTPLSACSPGNTYSNTVRIEPIAEQAEGLFPAEDRVLLYERLIQKLTSEKTIANVYRAGDSSVAARCAEFIVRIRMVSFDKGDQAVRASVGPLGHFVGTTKLKYHLTITTGAGMTVTGRDLKASEGSDTDSLNITKAIAKAVTRDLKKSQAKVHKA